LNASNSLVFDVAIKEGRIYVHFNTRTYTNMYFGTLHV